MLSPDTRTTAFELLRPPSGFQLDLAVLSTYTLDLETLLALPLSVLAHSDGGLDELLADPLCLQQAIRDAGDRIHAFVDESGIAIPRSARSLYSMLESSVHAVRAPNGGAFHPKVWVARFVASDENAEDLLRVAILSRNLTFDRSWDVALTSEASIRGRRRFAASRPLRDFLLTLPQLSTSPVHENVAARLKELAEQVSRTAFPAPDGFDDPVAFHLLGLQKRRRLWRPPSNGYRTLAVSPFISRTGLEVVRELSGNDRMLVSRQEELDKLAENAQAEWNKVFVLKDAAHGESEEGLAGENQTAAGVIDRPSGLHAKMIAVEHRWKVTWYVGSANLTSSAFSGSNVEMVASVTGKKGRKGGHSGHGIDRFLDDGFRKLCVEYERIEPEKEDPAVTDARKRLEAARDALLSTVMCVTCVSAGDLWTLTIDGDGIPCADDVEVVAWPVSVAEDKALRLEKAVSWRLPIARLTAFIAFRLSVDVGGVDDVRMTLRLPAQGIPEDRMHHLLRGLLDSPEKFLRFLRALLGGLDSVLGWAQDSGEGEPTGNWGFWQSGETLLDDLVRSASRDPDRLKPVRRLIDDLRKTEEGRRIVPDELFSIWTAVEEALAPESRL